MLTVATFLWGDRYRAEHVNALARQVATHYRSPHRFVAITDQPAGIECDTFPLWDDWRQLRSPHAAQGYPSCYPRLRVFARDIGRTLGDRFVIMDVDTLVLDDPSPLWHRPEPFVCLRNQNPAVRYGGGMWLLTAGARPQVWEQFGPHATKIKGGSDQAWLSHILGRPNEATWSQADGVYWFKQDDLARRPLPENARVVNFNGREFKPWQDNVPAWAREAYECR